MHLVSHALLRLLVLYRNAALAAVLALAFRVTLVVVTPVLSAWAWPSLKLLLLSLSMSMSMMPVFSAFGFTIPHQLTRLRVVVVLKFLLAPFVRDVVSHLCEVVRPLFLRVVLITCGCAVLRGCITRPRTGATSIYTTISIFFINYIGTLTIIFIAIAASRTLGSTLVSKPFTNRSSR